MLKKYFLFLFAFLLVQFSFAQCFQVLDGNGAFSATPEFVSCTPGNFTIFIQPNQNIGPYVIDWGDGTPNSTGASLTVGNNVSHTYNGATANYTLTITDNGSGCVVTGLVVLERNPLASIQLPSGDDNFGCTPVQFRFINSSTQISQNVTFVWDFGDGSPVETYNSTNLGDTIPHTYLPGVGVQSCDLEVTLAASNFCGTSNASFFPLKVWDLDEAQITPSNDLLCYPDTIVQYTNSTIRNCFPEGNQSQRYERWNFGDYWGLGRDSIIEWRPWNPPITPPPPIAYPGVGVYFVTLQDSSFCGIDDVTISIEITDAPTAVVTANRDTICEGEQVTFTNSSFGGQNRYRWNFDEGNGFEAGLGGGNQTVRYNTAGNYEIQLIVFIDGAQGCRDTASVPLVVLPSPDADFTFTPNNQCDSMLVSFTNASTGSISTYSWDFDNGNTFNGPNPPPQNYTSPGTYRVELTVSNAQGCDNTISKNIRVRQTPVAGFTVSSVCLNQLANFIDQSVSGGDPITDYKWYFGDGDSSTAQDPSHLYTAFGTYTVTQIVDNGFCRDTATLAVTVENEPTAAFTADTLAGCSRLTVNLTNASSANATNFRWNFGDGSAIVNARDTFHTYTNTTDFDTTFVIQLIARTTFGCADTTYDTVTVFPVPTPSFFSDAMVDCGPVEVNFTNTTVGDSLDFFWDFGDGTAIVNDTNPTHIFENKTLFINNYDVKLIVRSNNGCTDTSTQVVTVYPEPIFTFTAAPDSGCSPLVVRFPSVVGAVSYQWDFGDGGTASGPTPTHTFINSTTNNQTYNVRLIATNSFGCTDTTFGDVLVFPNPTSNFVLDTNRGCQPLPISITNNSTGATVFDWSFGDGTSSDTTDASFIKTYTNLTSASRFNNLELIAITDQGCRDTSVQVVEVHPFIEAGFVAIPDTGCSPLNVSFQNQSVGVAVGGYQWQFGDGNSSVLSDPSNIYVNSNTNGADQSFTAQLTVASNEGCTAQTQANILVYAKPVARFSMSDSAGCQPLSVDFTNTSTLRDNCAWNFGNGTTSTSCNAIVSSVYNNTTSFFPVDFFAELTVTTNNGCIDRFEDTITVFPQISAEFIPSDTSGCSPLTVQFQNQSVGAQNYVWTFGDGQSANSPNSNNTFINPSENRDSVYQVQLLATSTYTKYGVPYTCQSSITKDIEVFAKPIARFSIDTNRSCNPFPVNITNTSSLRSDSCYWNFGDGNALLDSCFTSYQKIFTNTQSSVPVNRRILLEVYTDKGCSDTKDTIVTINPDVQASFTAPDTGCSPFIVNFQNLSTGGNTYQWDFDDGNTSTTFNPSNTFTYAGPNNDTTYQVDLLVTSVDGCVDQMDTNIVVYPKPIASFTIDTNRSCNPFPLFITNNSTFADSCYWNFGDGTELLDDCFNTFQKVLTNTQSSVPITRTILLEVYTNNGCFATMDTTVTINPDVRASFTAPDTGCSPFNVNFQNLSTSGLSYNWDFDDGGSSNLFNPNNTFTYSGPNADTTYNVKLVVTSAEGCVEEMDTNIVIYPKPTADFTLDETEGCHPFPVTITNTSNLGNECAWDFGDGFALADSCFNTYTKTYSNNQSSIPLNRNIRLITTSVNGCLDTSFQSITVNPEIVADFDTVLSGCNPLTVDFVNRSTGVSNTGYTWLFGDNGSNTVRNPQHTFFNLGLTDTTFTIKLKVESPYQCADSAEQDITIFPKPTADFSVSTNDGCQPLIVDFTNNSTLRDATSNCIWTFGDGNSLISCNDQTTHTYFNQLSLVPLNYTAQLEVITSNGCSDVLTRNINVKPQIIADFTAPDTACSPLNAEFRSQSFGVGVGDYDWTFGDGRIGDGEIVTNQYINTTGALESYTVRLTATSFYGCEDVAEKTVYVRPTPEPDFTPSPLNQLFPASTVNLVNTTFVKDNWDYVWDFKDTSTSTLVDPGSHTYSYWGQYNIQLKASSPFCSDSISKLVEIEVPFPVADFDDSLSGCQPLEVTFNNKSLYGRTYLWDFGDGSTSNAENPSHIYFNDGEYNVTLKVTGFEQGKEDDTIKFDYIKVFKSPNADFITNKDKVFVPNDPLVFSNRSVNADTYFWNFGDGNTSTERSPTYQYTLPGEYQVFLVASSNSGCVDTAFAPNEVIAELEGRIEVPNAFTPNPRGSNGGTVNINPGAGEFNDVFYAKLSGTTKYELNIFNKWGELLYVSKDINIGWDGYYRNELCKQDVYVWKITAEFADGTSVVKVGDLMLLR